MTQHAQILDESEESLGRPLIGSIALHVGIVVVSMAFTWYSVHYAQQWGDEHPMGGAVGVESVDKIPLPNRSITPNRLANDVESSVPSKPEKVEKKKAPEEDPDAIALNRTKPLKKPVEESARVQKYETVPPRPNQVYSPNGSSLNSPEYGKQGIGGVGIGLSTVAGHGCGGYLDLVRMRIQQRWDIQPISAGIRVGAAVSLVLQRGGGAPGDVNVIQSSGSSEVDFAARRAIAEASPFPPFLPNCEGNQARIEVRFQPKR